MSKAGDWMEGPLDVRADLGVRGDLEVDGEGRFGPSTARCGARPPSIRGNWRTDRSPPRSSRGRWAWCPRASPSWAPRPGRPWATIRVTGASPCSPTIRSGSTSGRCPPLLPARCRALPPAARSTRCWRAAPCGSSIPRQTSGCAAATTRLPAAPSPWRPWAGRSSWPAVSTRSAARCASSGSTTRPRTDGPSAPACAPHAALSPWWPARGGYALGGLRIRRSASAPPAATRPTIR